jgi:hypothetical protein
MVGLYENKFLPITFNFYFVETSILNAATIYSGWSRYKNKKFTLENISGTLEEQMRYFNPMVNNLDTKFLFVDTTSSWSVFFQKDYEHPQSFCQFSVKKIARSAQCRGLTVTCSGNACRNPDKTIFVDYDYIVFDYIDTDENDNRAIWLAREDNRWLFETYGKPLPFEQVDKYKEKRTRDRFTPDMLEQYCSSLGIQLLDPGFYGPHGIILEFKMSWLQKFFIHNYKEMSISKWQEKNIK